MTARRIRARFGRFGRVYVRFEALRSHRVAPPRPCTGSVVVRTGTFTGTIPVTYFVAFKGDSVAKPLCLALAGGSAGRVAILRLILISAGPGAFTFAPELSAAHLDLPAPFAGVGNFATPHAWTGTLTASFPGAPDVPFAGANFHARMKRF